MKFAIKHLEHSRIDSLSDGIFSIALTLLGFDLIGAVKTTAEGHDLNASLLKQWPVFFSFLLGFFVLYAIWYEYHATSQYIVGTSALIIWTHGFTLLCVSMVPFGTALLGENINTPNMSWAVFYFGLILFGDKPVAVLLGYFTIRKGGYILTDDAPVSPEAWGRMGRIWYSMLSVYGAVAMSISLVYPWAALALYGVYLFSKLNPIATLNSSARRINRVINLGIEEEEKSKKS